VIIFLCHILSYFVQFVQNLEFFHFPKSSENLISREKIKSGVRKNWVWRVTYKLNEMGQYMTWYIRLVGFGLASSSEPSCSSPWSVPRTFYIYFIFRFIYPIIYIYIVLVLSAYRKPLYLTFYIYIYVLAETPLSRLSTKHWGELAIWYLCLIFYSLYLAVVT
jgi:hypothetical protein